MLLYRPVFPLVTLKRFGLLQPHFGHLSCIQFVCMTCKVKGMLYNSNPSIVEKLPLVAPFRGLVTSFEKAYKSAYQLRFGVSLTLNSHLFLGCIIVVEMPGM